MYEDAMCHCSLARSFSTFRTFLFRVAFVVHAQSSGNINGTDMNHVIPNPIGPVCPYVGPVYPCVENR